LLFFSFINITLNIFIFYQVVVLMHSLNDVQT
jgi:hypothetical protein